MTVSKKQRILDTALTLFATQGIHATSTASIAKQSGVATGTLFHHFPSKAELISALYLSVKADLTRAVSLRMDSSLTTNQNLQRIWNRAIDWALDNPDQYRFFRLYEFDETMWNSVNRDELEGLRAPLLAIMEAGQASGELRKLDISLMHQHCLGMYLSTTNYLLRHAGSADEVKRLKASSFSLFWHSIARTDRLPNGTSEQDGLATVSYNHPASDLQIQSG